MADDWIMAERGSGAFVRRLGEVEQRLQVADPVPLSEMVGTASLTYMPAESKPQLFANLAKIRVPSNYRVAGHEYRLMASGHTHFTAYNKLMPWDHLAGALIAEEAGAYVARFDGSRYLPQHRSGGLLTATDRDSWQVLRREVFTV